MSDEQEVWKDVPGFTGYQVSDHGRLRSRRLHGRHCHKLSAKWRQLPGTKDRDGYLRTVICTMNGTRVNKKLHQLVLEAFIGPCPRGLQGRHLDDIRDNNHLSNLCWGTPAENAQDRKRNGHNADQRGDKCYNAKLTWEQADEIRRRARSGEKSIALALLFGISR